MIRIIQSVIITYLLVFPAGLLASVAEIRLMESIAVEAPMVELGEIAYIESSDRNLRDQLAQIEICEAPRGKNPKIISSFKVKALLESVGLDDSCRVLGRQTTAMLSSRIVDREEIIGSLKEWIDAHHTDSAHVELNFLSLPPKWEIPTGEAIEISAEPVGGRQAGTVPFRLFAKVNGRVLSSARARVEIALHGEAYILTRPLEPGERLTPDHVALQQTDLTAGTGTPLADLDAVMGLAAKHRLRVGTVLNYEAFEKPVLVKRGSINQLLVRNGNVELSLSGAQALQDGRAGELVLFSNPMNKREPLKATVVREGLALIELR